MRPVISLVGLVPAWEAALFDIADFPVQLQPMIQQGYLETSFEDYLDGNMGYWVSADQDIFVEEYQKNRGVTITRTRPGLKAPVVVPTNNTAAQTPPNDGVTPSDFSIEQYTFSPFELTDGIDLDLIGTNWSIVNRFEHQVKSNYHEAVQSVDLLARDTYIASYAAAHTIFTASAGSGTGLTIHVDDIRGFRTVITVGPSSTYGVLTPVSPSVPLPSFIYPGGVFSAGYATNVTAAVADVSNISKYVPAGVNSPYGSPGAPTNARGNGVSGTLTIDSSHGHNIGVNDVIVAGDAPTNIFAGGVMHFSELSGISGGLTSANILDATNVLDNNAVPHARNRDGSEEGTFCLHCAPNVMRSLYNDSDFKQANQTLGQSDIYLRGRISEYLGVTFLPNTNAPKIALTPYGGSGYANLSFVTGHGAIVDAWYQGLEDWAMNEFNPAYVFLQEGIAEILMPAYADRQGRQMHIDFLTIRDMVAPTDVTRSSVVLTGNGARRARAVPIWTWSQT